MLIQADRLKKNWGIDIARGGIGDAHILIHCLNETIEFQAKIGDKLLPIECWSKLMAVPVEQNTGLDSRTEQYIGKINPNVIRRAPFEIFEVIKPVKVYSLHPEDYQISYWTMDQKEVYQRLKLLKAAIIFMHLEYDQLEKLADAMEIVELKSDEVLFEKGGVGKFLTLLGLSFLFLFPSFFSLFLFPSFFFSLTFSFLLFPSYSFLLLILVILCTFPCCSCS